jgi:NADH-quinone oxidoreductase subunit L
LAYLVYYTKKIPSDLFVSSNATRAVYSLLQERYGFTAGYDAFAEKIVYGFSRVVDWFDLKIIDGIVNGISSIITRTGEYTRRMQTGRAQSYATVIIAGISVILVLLYLLGGLR